LQSASKSRASGIRINTTKALPLHLNAINPESRASNYAHKYRTGYPARMAPQTERTIFGRGALLPYAS